MIQWIRDNYGWQAKRSAWVSLAFGLVAAVVLLVLVGLATR